ncbi:MAG: M56 family metallopeptidase [Planctomycetota bacterium]|jgi:beta-lactamase regulating signal transducer with metallopeptidase domain
MHGVTTLLNSTGRSFVDFAAVMLAQSSVLIVILLSLDLILRKRVRAVVRYWLWMLVLLKLVLPTSLSLPTGLGYWFGDRLPEIAVEEAFAAEEPEPKPAAGVIGATETVTLEQAVTAVPPRDVPAQSTPPAPAESEPARRLPRAAPAMTWQGLVFLAWLAAVAAMVLLVVQRMFFVRGLVAQSKPVSGSMLDVFEQCRRQMRVQRQVGLKLSPVAASPSVCGLFRSIILIPEGLAEKLDSQHSKSILLHELAHIKRGDLWISFVQTLLQIAYIYSPLLWAANAVIRKVREQAVDEMVLAAMGDEAEDYPETLLNVSRLTFSRPALSLRLVGVVESKKALTSRIKHILSRPFPKTAKLGIAGFFVVLIIGAIALPMASKTESRENQALIQILKQDGNRKRGNAAKKMMDNVRSGEITPALAEEALQAVTRRLAKHPKGRNRRLDSYPYVCWEELELAWVLIENDKVPANYVADFVQALEVVGCTYGKEGDGVFRLYGDLNIPRKDIITNYKLHVLSMNDKDAPRKRRYSTYSPDLPAEV